MASRKKKAACVGTSESIQKLISKSLHNKIKAYQKELQIKEIKKHGSRAQKITYIHASHKLCKHIGRSNK